MILKKYQDLKNRNFYIPQEVIVTESGKAYTVRSLDGENMFDFAINISIKDREFTDEELLALKVNIHLGNIVVDKIRNPEVIINDGFHRNYDNHNFVE